MLLLIYCTCAVLMRQLFLLGGGVTIFWRTLAGCLLMARNAGLSPSGVTEQCCLQERLGLELEAKLSCKDR